jgi:hypothetical protein
VIRRSGTDLLTAAGHHRRSRFLTELDALVTDSISGDLDV